MNDTEVIALQAKQIIELRIGIDQAISDREVADRKLEAAEARAVRREETIVDLQRRCGIIL